MNIYLLSTHKIRAVENKMSSDFVVDDLIEALRDGETSVVDKAHVADIVQASNSRLKYRYTVSITRK